MVSSTFFHAYHCVAICVQLSIILVLLVSGVGSEWFVEYKCNHSEIAFNWDILFQSLVHAKYDEYETNHIVDRIARIVITTISSTRVKAFLFSSPLRKGIIGEFILITLFLFIIKIFLIIKYTINYIKKYIKY